MVKVHKSGLGISPDVLRAAELAAQYAEIEKHQKLFDETEEARRMAELASIMALSQEGSPLERSLGLSADKLADILGHDTFGRYAHIGTTPAMEEDLRIMRELRQLQGLDIYRSPASDVLAAMEAPVAPAREHGESVTKPVASRPAPNPAATPISSIAEIGHRVRDARKAMGMTQQRFADLAGVGRRFLGELERGKSSLDIGLVLTVCEAAGIKIGFLP
ncbi:helix-turn-helix transcriptional regulator [Novosphingobium sp. PS1R-30]|uniref:Helix-turn-helix transcriptional regulator n=1 Tax=Novosphingobium anseongense TaxID=3133436 RepID=A0ABU8S0J7_9SPHN